MSTYGEPVDGDDPPPEPPRLGLLRAAGIPLRVDDAQMEQIAGALADHRARVHEVAGRTGASDDD